MDHVEQHAGAMANAVAHGGAPPVLDRPGTAGVPATAAAGSLPPSVPGALARPDRGLPLPPVVRERVEPHLGVDLRAARVVTGPAAAAAAGSGGARAFTAGSTIVLGHGQSAHDSRLMTHEATHVAQQASGRVALH